MLKIITKSAHNALLYQIEDLKKKLESANENIESYKEDLELSERKVLQLSNSRISAKERVDELFKLLEDSEKIRRAVLQQNDLLSKRHKANHVKTEKLQKANTSLLSKNESLTAENHRLGNLLQVKCDEVKTLEKKVKEVEKEEKLSTDIIGEMEYHVLHALKSIDVPATRKPKNVMQAIKLLRDALKPLQ